MVVALAILALAARAAEPPAELSALKAKLAKTTALRASFTQTRHLAALKDALVTRGTFSYERPGKLRWATSPPAESELVLEGTRAAMRYPALKTEQEFDLAQDPGMAAVFESLAAILQADVGLLVPLYELKMAKGPPLSLDLVPRSPQVQKVVERVHLEFDGQLNLSNVVLYEAGGDRTEIAFRDHAVTGPGR